MKKTLIMICGKSAVGKDTFAKKMNKKFLSLGIDSHLSISHTTRYPRENECDGRDYYFTTDSLAKYFIDDDQFLEYNHFNNWFYGTRKTELEKAKVTIMVLNPFGIRQVIKNTMGRDIDIYVIYLEVPVGVRLFRSIKREGKFKKEFLRRLKADNKDFKNLSFYHRVNYIKVNYEDDRNEVIMDLAKRLGNFE